MEGYALALLNPNLFVFAVIVLLLIFFKNQGKRKNGLKGILNLWDAIRYGLIRELGKPNYVAMQNFEKYFGPVFLHKFSSYDTVCVMDLGLAKKIMASPEFLNRFPEGHIFYDRSNKKSMGPLFGNGDNWTLTRKLAINALQSVRYSEGPQLEYFVTNEIQQVLQNLRNVIKTTSEFQPSGFFNIATSNHFWHALTGSRFAHDDLHGRELHKYFHNWQQIFNFGSALLYTFQWLRHIPKLTEHCSWKEGHQKLFQLFRGIMKDKQARMEFTKEPKDCIEYFLQKMHLDRKNILEGNSNGKTALNEEDILLTCVDLFIAGSVNISYELEFAILFMALHPKVQEKVQEEIHSVFGNDCVPRLDSKHLMLYTEATTLEILRHSSIVGISSRCPVVDAKINDTSVSKDTIVAINHYGIHFSSKLWTDPKDFRPERFLNPDGTKIINQDKIIPFGYGKRKCIGESAARSTFFLFYTSLLQKFTFSISSNHGPPSLKHLCGIVKSPEPYFVSVKERETIICHPIA